MKSTGVKIFLTVVGLVLVFAGGVDLGITTVPGLAIIAGTWGIKW
jgi:hypothetical protein